MFLGHFGIGFAAKRVAPRASLGTLFVAAQLVDLVLPTLVLLDIEKVRIQPGITRVAPLDFVSYPYSHSLLLGFGWALLLAAAYWVVRRYTTGAFVIVAVSVSHWVLDLLVHRPDLPLLPSGGPKVGFGLWSSLVGTMTLEGVIFAVGLILYVRATTARDRRGAVGLWLLVATLVAIYLTSLFGPPPPDTAAFGWAGQAQWLLVLFAFWVDSHRRSDTRQLSVQQSPVPQSPVQSP